MEYSSGRVLGSADISDRLNYSRIFMGRIFSVNPVKMQMGVQIMNTIEAAIDVHIPMLYISGAVNSGIVVVPRIGDYVLMAMQQETWVCVGYTQQASVLSEKSSPSTPDNQTTTWAEMLKSRDMGTLGIGAPPPKITEGDFAIFLHDKGHCSDFLMTKDGQIVISTGLARLILSQIDVSLTEVLNHKMTVCANGLFGVEQGFPRIPIPPFEVPTDYLFKIYNDLMQEKLEFGYINLKGISEISDNGLPLRFRVKTPTAEINIDVGGNINIKGTASINIESSGPISIQTDTDMNMNGFNVNGTAINEVNLESLTSNVQKLEGDYLELKAKLAALISATGLTIDADMTAVNGAFATTGFTSLGIGTSVLANTPLSLIKASLLELLAEHQHITMGTPNLLSHVHIIQGVQSGEGEVISLPSIDLLDDNIIGTANPSMGLSIGTTTVTATKNVIAV